MLGRPQDVIAEGLREPEQLVEQLVGLLPLAGHVIVDGEGDQRGVHGGVAVARSAVVHDLPQRLPAAAQPVEEDRRVDDPRGVRRLGHLAQRPDGSIESSQSRPGGPDRIRIEAAGQGQKLGNFGPKASERGLEWVPQFASPSDPTHVQERLECVGEHVVDGIRAVGSLLDRADQQAVGGVDVALIDEEQVRRRDRGLERFADRRVGPLGLGEQPGNVAQVACHPSDVGGPGQATPPVGATRAQLGRPYQGGNRSGGITPPPRPVGDRREQRGDLFVGLHRCFGEVPRPMLGPLDRRLCQSDVRSASLVRGREPHDTRANERVSEHEPTRGFVDLHQPGLLRRGKSPQFGVPGGGSQDAELAGAVQHREQQQRSGRHWEVRDTGGEQVLHATGEWQESRGCWPRDSSPPVQRTRQLQQGQRVALRLGHQASAHAGRKHREPLLQQIACRGVVQRPQLVGWGSSTVEEALHLRAGGGQESDLAPREAAGHEAQHVRGRAIQPLQVVHDQQDGTLLRRLQ
ncbi:MAG TPA: hypothetical protein VFH30_06930 [Acidimicrobiales bacterium]|nr:hypothetical protein [Acidimicrobiales bacterium]